jgi:hypothetical protein
MKYLKYFLLIVAGFALAIFAVSFSKVKAEQEAQNVYVTNKGPANRIPIHITPNDPAQNTTIFEKDRNYEIKVVGENKDTWFLCRVTDIKGTWILCDPSQGGVNTITNWVNTEQIIRQKPH